MTAGARILLISGSTRIGSGNTAALLFCTPEYAGTLPGSLKNLLDWTVGGGEIYGKPVAWINVAAGGRGTGAQEHLALVLRYVGSVTVEPACALISGPAGRGRAGRHHRGPRDPRGAGRIAHRARPACPARERAGQR